MKRLLFAVLAIGLFIALAPIWALSTPHPLSSVNRLGASPPYVIPAAALGGDTNAVCGGYYNCDTDPGYTPDTHLFAMVEDNAAPTSTSLPTNCPGGGVTSANPAGCMPSKYVNYGINFCTAPLPADVYSYANSNDEAGFLHDYYPTSAAPTPGNRSIWGYPSSCSPLPSALPSSSPAPSINLGDGNIESYIYVYQLGDCLINICVPPDPRYTKLLPAPYAAWLDNINAAGDQAVGPDSAIPTANTSAEYGCGLMPSGFANAVGCGMYNAGISWMNAIANFINSQCGPPMAGCVPIIFNGIANQSTLAGAGSETCSDGTTLSNPHCHVEYYPGVIDDKIDLASICSKLTATNLRYLNLEGAIAGTRGANPRGLNNYQSVTYEVNTIAGLYQHTTDNCSNTDIINEETSYGLSGGTSCPGTTGNPYCGLTNISGGYPIRIDATALRFLVPNPSTNLPDRVLQLYYTLGDTATEVPYFFEQTLVPEGAEIAVPSFMWNGKNVTTGNGCPSKSNDTGGAVALEVECVDVSGSHGPAAVLCQQWKHLYINATDYGAMAVCLNEANTGGSDGAGSTTIKARWFCNACDPISTYGYYLVLKYGEMTSVPYGSGSISLKTCTNPMYCTCTPSVCTLANLTEPFGGAGTILCGAGDTVGDCAGQPNAIILFQNN